jgi:hypothetical protein
MLFLMISIFISSLDINAAHPIHLDLLPFN